MYLMNAVINYWISMANRFKSKRPPGRPATDPLHDARNLLLAAATSLFAKQGVAATTFANIAQEAGLTPAMVHYYFKDREQLLDAVVDERLAPLIVSVWKPVSELDRPSELISRHCRKAAYGDREDALGAINVDA